MPVLFVEKRIYFSSGEKEAPETRVVAMNCSIVYCLAGRATGFAASAGRASAQQTATTLQVFRWQIGLIVPPSRVDILVQSPVADDGRPESSGF
jgi:hypothetical protein